MFVNLSLYEHKLVLSQFDSDFCDTHVASAAHQFSVSIEKN